MFVWLWPVARMTTFATATTITITTTTTTTVAATSARLCYECRSMAKASD